MMDRAAGVTVGQERQGGRKNADVIAAVRAWFLVSGVFSFVCSWLTHGSFLS